MLTGVEDVSYFWSMNFYSGKKKPNKHALCINFYEFSARMKNFFMQMNVL